MLAYCPRTGDSYSDAPDAASPCDEGPCHGCAYWHDREMEAQQARESAAEDAMMERGL